MEVFILLIFKYSKFVFRKMLEREFFILGELVYGLRIKLFS